MNGYNVYYYPRINDITVSIWIPYGECSGPGWNYFQSQILFNAQSSVKYAHFTSTASQRKNGTIYYGNSGLLHNDNGVSGTVYCDQEFDTVQRYDGLGLSEADQCNDLGLIKFSAAFAPGDTLYNAENKPLCTLDSTGIINGAENITPCLNGLFNNRAYWLNGKCQDGIYRNGKYEPYWSDAVHYAREGTCLMKSALPGCYIKDGQHAGAIKITYDGNDYYACFNISTGRWEATLPV